MVSDGRSVTPLGLHRRLQNANRVVGLGCGLALLGAGAMILFEIVMRRVAFGVLGGTDEISGYVMAGLVSWGAAYALIDRAHIRIDLLHRRVGPLSKTVLDMAALAALTAVSAVILTYGWAVLEKSVSRGSTANTPLETPLWIPQSIWLAGWVWFAFASTVLLLLTGWAAFRKEWAVAAAISGPESDDPAADPAPDDPAGEGAR